MKPKSISRRSFLLTAGVGGAGAAAVAAGVVKQATPGDAVEVKEEARSGYRVSAHIEKYYKTTEV